VAPFRGHGAAVDIGAFWNVQTGGPQGAQHNRAVGGALFGREEADLAYDTAWQGDLKSRVVIAVKIGGFSLERSMESPAHNLRRGLDARRGAAMGGQIDHGALLGGGWVNRSPIGFGRLGPILGEECGLKRRHAAVNNLMRPEVGQGRTIPPFETDRILG